MAAALALWLIGAVAGEDAPPLLRCLPAQDGFLAMRLRGSIERDIRWH